MSGYQESLVKVSCLAEAAGIRKAFDESGNSLFGMYGVERAVRDVGPELPSQAGDMLCLPRVTFKGVTCLWCCAETVIPTNAAVGGGST